MINPDIVRLTLRQQLSLSRLVLVGLLAALPVFIAVVFAFSTNDERDDSFTADLLDSVVLLGVLPLVALLVGTGVLGGEVQDGTVSYLLLKPISRASIIVSKLLVAAVTTVAAVAPAVVITALIILGGQDSGLTMGFLVAAILGAVAYCSWFVLLSVLTARAFIIGLLYVFLWEGVVTAIFQGARYLSIRHYTRAVVDAIASQPEDVFDADLSAAVAFIGMALITVGAAWSATSRLRAFEARDRGL